MTMDEAHLKRKRQLSQDSQDKPPQKREQRDEDIPQRLEKTCAKWCSLFKDGSCTIDETIIRNTLSPEIRNEPQFLQDIISGRATGGSVWPLIFGIATEHDEESVWFRSLPYFETLIADVETAQKIYRDLGQHRKWLVAVGVRDLYLASWKGHADEREKRILDVMVRVIEQSVETINIDGMRVSSCPTASHKVLKFIENLDRKIGLRLIPGFAQVVEEPRLFAVFVDPLELSYHNFENIVPLDRWIETRRDEINLSLTAVEQRSSIHDVLTCKIHGPGVNLLKELSLLDLYTQPLNKGTRGGQRFIFNSSLLSKALTSAIRHSSILRSIASGSLASSFEFVNYVFRCNHFSPGDTRFTNHLDTPYYDSIRSHVSKYTLLIYQSSGTGNPALRLDSVELKDMEEFTCVIFDQKLRHEGQPFINSDKIFLRTELIFKDESLTHDNRIAPLFSTACYLTGQDVFGEELIKYAHECFERANSLHWALEQDPSTSSKPAPPLYLYKSFRSAQFITNGYDYYFKWPASPSIDLSIADCAILAILDYLNCKITQYPFRTLCETKSIRRKLSSTSEIWALFEDNDVNMAQSALNRLSTQDITPLIRTHTNEPFIPRRMYSGTPDPDDDPESDPPCCPFHCWQTFDAWKDPDMRDEYRKCWSYTRKQLFNSPLVILGQDLYINECQILVQGDRIYILHDKATDTDTASSSSSGGPRLPPLNFAACWAELLPSVMITVDGEVRTPELLIPPILFHEYEDGWHLVLDLFRNDWVVSVDEEKDVALPVLTNEIPQEGDLVTFWETVGFDREEAWGMTYDDGDENDDDWGSFVWSVDEDGGGTADGSGDDSEEDYSDIAESSDSSVTL